MGGLQTKTHSGLIHLVNVHFVRTGRLAPEAVRVLTNLEGQRLMADYDAASVFTERMADDALLAAEQFGECVEERLRTAGYL